MTRTLTVNYLEYLAIRAAMSVSERLCYLVLGDVSSNSFDRQSAEGLSVSLLSWVHCQTIQLSLIIHLDEKFSPAAWINAFTQ